MGSGEWIPCHIYRHSGESDAWSGLVFFFSWDMEFGSWELVSSTEYDHGWMKYGGRKRVGELRKSMWEWTGLK